MSDFINFIKQDNARGYFLFFKGESNITSKSLLYGLGKFLLTRRFVTMSSYKDDTLKKITSNYIIRLKEGSVHSFPEIMVQTSIDELQIKFSLEDKKFWSGNSVKLVELSRFTQRAICYLNALRTLSDEK
jgi:hypothetical protein